MKFGMSLGMTLRVSQALELRQEMEINLTQSLLVIQQLKFDLILYREREEALKKLYKKALERGMVKLYNKHGIKFEYALIREKDVPANIKIYGNLAFSHCLFKGFEAILFGKQYALANGSWLIFVIYDIYPSMPENYIEYAAVHERGEQVTLGDHNLASKLEFAISRKENNLVQYMAWLEENYPAKFADVFSYQTHMELPANDEFQKVLETFSSSEEATKVRQIIEEFEWPYRLLQKLMLYKKRNEEVIEIVSQALHVAKILAGESNLPLKELISRLRDEVTKKLRLIIQRELKQYISFPHLDSLWRELRIGADDKFNIMLEEKQRINPDYLQELVDANIGNSLPRDGVLSFSFAEALKVL